MFQSNIQFDVLVRIGDSIRKFGNLRIQISDLRDLDIRISDIFLISNINCLIFDVILNISYIRTF